MALPVESRTRQEAYLEAMGIQAWHPRGRLAQAAPVAGTAVSVASTDTMPRSDSVLLPDEVTGMDWSCLQQAVASCTRCGLHERREHTVFGAGDPHADWLVVGEAPGEEEDRQGLPFVGRAGELLTAMLQAVGLDRSQVFITNIIKCRPPGNRDPHSDEIAGCDPYIARQVELIAPRLILALGRVAAQNLLHSDLPIGKLRGKVHRYGEQGIPLVATYHPAYLLRTPPEKRKAWEDLQLARSLCRTD